MRSFVARKRFVPWLALVLGLFVVAALGYGTRVGFPVQDDNYMVRLLRLGGPQRIVTDHADRPAFGHLLAAATGWAGEKPVPYVVMGVIGWLLFAGEAVWLWLLLFPEWASAWPVVGLAIAAPVVAQVQFSTLTVLIPCVLPVMLVLLGLGVLIRDRTWSPRWIPGAAAFFLAAAAATLSEYALAAAAAAVVFLILFGRWRSGVWIAGGVALGYAVFRATAALSLRKETDPHRQMVEVLSRPWTRPARIASAAWGTVVGAWGDAASGLHVDWSSKSTVLSFALALLAGGIAAAIWNARVHPAEEPVPTRRVAALGGGLLAGLWPAITLKGWPLLLHFETRYLVPVLAFATFSTVALVLTLVRPRWSAVPIFLLAFLAAHTLAARAIEEARLQRSLERMGERLRPYVAENHGLVVLVSPDRLAQSREEIMAETTSRWPFPAAGRLWLMRPEDARERLGPRSGCRAPESIDTGHQILRWPRADEPVRLVLWDAGDPESFDPEPYFLGCDR